MAIQIAVNTFLFASRFTDEQLPVLSTIRELGFEAVEIALVEPGDFDPRKVRRALAERGLALPSVATVCGPGRDLRGTPEEQRAALDFLKRCIDVTADLECGLLGGVLYSRCGRADPVPPELRREQLRTVAGHLQEVCAHAGKRGVLLAIEPIIRFESDLLNTCHEAMELVAAVGSPQLGVLLDTFHMNTEEANSTLAVVEAGAKLLAIHASDNHRGAPGTGAFDWQGFRDALRRIGYGRAIAIEAFHPDVPEISYAAAVRRKRSPTNAALARQGLAYLRALFAD